jgi:hypothetical protein
VLAARSRLHVCVLFGSNCHEEFLMSRIIAPLGFALGAVWVAYLFFLVH